MSEGNSYGVTPQAPQPVQSGQRVKISEIGTDHCSEGKVTWVSWEVMQIVTDGSFIPLTYRYNQSSKVWNRFDKNYSVKAI